jgi:hypothetical protein
VLVVHPPPRRRTGAETVPTPAPTVSEASENTAVQATESDAAPPEVSASSPRADERPVDVIETALAKALTEAAGAGRFDVVAQLAKELEARRLAGAANVVPFARDPQGTRRERP